MMVWLSLLAWADSAAAQGAAGPVIELAPEDKNGRPLAVPPAARFDKPVNLDTALATIRAVVTQSDSGAES